MFSYLKCFLGLFLFRYNRIIVQAICSLRVRPYPVSASLFSAQDVTVVIPTICTDTQLDTFKQTLNSIDRTKPHSTIVVTPVSRVAIVRQIAETVNEKIKIIGSPFKSKRYQIWLGVKEVNTNIVVLADDDVEWRGGEKAMPPLLAPFADMFTGAVGTCQRVERTNWWNVVQYLGALYIARRNHETTATSFIDGGLSCLSGRTLAIRTLIIKQPWFKEEYLGEMWGGHRLNPDDDNFITRWCYRLGYKIRIQSDENALVYTTLEATLKGYISQCIRWERSRWRHTFTLVAKHPCIWTKQPWSAWALYFQVLFHSLWVEPIMAFFWYKSKGLVSDPQWYQRFTLLFIAWATFAKFYKTADHYRQNPKDLLLFPAAVSFGYCHGLIKLYALCTLNNVTWGTREADEIENGFSPANTSSEDAVLSHDLKNRRPLVISASNKKFQLEDGSFVFDAACGAAVTCLGSKSNSRVRKAITRIRVAYASDRSFTTIQAQQLSQELLKTTYGHMVKAYFCSSGSDAMEAAMKLARQYFYDLGENRDVFVAREQSYHGATLGALGLGSHVQRRKVYKCLLPDNTSHVSACNPYRDCEKSLSNEEYVARKVKELEEEFERLGPKRVIAFVAEPIVGAALGCVAPVPGYLQAMKDVCQKHGALFILDEIMCGFGRTGTLHAWEQYGVVPDIQVLGKGLGAGEQPIGAILCNQRIQNAICNGSGGFSHGFTFQNHALACAAALEVLNIIREKMLLENVKRLGSLLESLLRKELGNHPNVGDIRGIGFFWGIEFVENKSTKAPFKSHLEVHKRLHRTAMDKYQLYIYNGNGTVDGTNGDHIIIAPPFTINDLDVRFIVERVRLTIEHVFANLGADR